MGSGAGSAVPFVLSGCATAASTPDCEADDGSRESRKLTFDKLRLSGAAIKFSSVLPVPESRPGVLGRCSAMLSPGRIEPPAGALRA